MIQGEVTPDSEAVIPLTIRASAGPDAAVEAVLDTGFTGFLTLPANIISTLGLKLFGDADVMLADGTIVTLHKFEATVQWDGRDRDILLLEAEGGPLMGMRLLYGSRVVLDVVDGGPVTITGLSSP
jgi:clan AA aspartic protease